MTGPEPHLDLQDFRESVRKVANQRRVIENLLEEATCDAAQAQAAYDRGVATAFIEYRAEGYGAGEAEVRARGKAAELKKVREIKIGMVRVYHRKLDGLDGERASLHRIGDWSKDMSHV